MSEFKVGDRVRVIKENEIQDAIGYIFKIEGDKIWLNICGYHTCCYEDEIEFVSMSLDRKIEQLEQRIEKLEKCVMGEQNSLEKCENVSTMSKNGLLTEDERVILRNMNKDFKWIFRDIFNNLIIQKKKPKRVKHRNNEFVLEGVYVPLFCYKHLFKFIKFEDEPYNIEELLKGECGNE